MSCNVVVRAALFALVVGLCFAPRPLARGQGAVVTNVGGTLTLGNGSLGGSSFTYPYNAASPSITILYVLPRVGPAFFTGELTYSTGGDTTKYLTFPNGSIFGHYAYFSDTRYIYHFDMGFEYVIDAADGHDGVFFYDFKSGDFLYTSPTLSFPYLYDFTLDTFLYYYPDPANAGHYNTGGVRYFYNFATGQIITR